MKNYRNIIGNARKWLSIALDYLKGHPRLVRFAIFAAIYIFIRFGWQGSIEFGYDPGRLSQMVVDILQRNDLVNTPQYILDNIQDGALAWGPMFIYFMIPFFLITRDPLIITNLLIGFQFIGIIALYLSVELLYNRRVAFFATIFILLFPWHVYFTRMIYNPSMLLWSIPLVMYVTLLIVKKGKQKLLFVLPALWLFMIQFHFVGVTILALSFVYIVVHRKKVEWKYFRIGLLLGIIPLIPILVFDSSHNFQFTKGLVAANKKPVVTDNDPVETVRVVLEKTMNYMFLKDVENHLGYASQEFFSRLPFVYNLLQPVYVILFFASMMLFLFMLFWKPKADDIIVLLWVLAVTIFLILFNLKNSKDITINQRYFIPSFFGIGIMIGRALDIVLEKVFCFLKSVRLKRIGKPFRKIKPPKLIEISMYIASCVFALCFGLFMITYHTLIVNYDYPQPGWYGWLSTDSGPPYVSAYKAISTALREAKLEGEDAIVLSDDVKINNGFHLPNYIQYIWWNVFNQNENYDPSTPFFFLSVGPPQGQGTDQLGEIRRFGVFRLIRKIEPGKTPVSKSVSEPSPAAVEPVIRNAKLILSLNSGMCIGVENSSTLDGAFFVQSDYRAEPQQLFYIIESEEKGYFYFISAQSGKFVTTRGGDMPHLSPGNNSPGQKWEIEVVSGKYRFLSKIKGKALAVENGSRNNFARIVCVEPDPDDKSQYWKISVQN